MRPVGRARTPCKSLRIRRVRALRRRPKPGRSRSAGRPWSSPDSESVVGPPVTLEREPRFPSMRRLLMAATLLLAACTQAPAAHSVSPTLTPSTSASPTPEVAHFVAPEPAAAKTAPLKGGGDAVFWDFVAFHEVGLRPGQSVSYQVIGTGTANY